MDWLDTSTAFTRLIYFYNISTPCDLHSPTFLRLALSRQRKRCLVSKRISITLLSTSVYFQRFLEVFSRSRLSDFVKIFFSKNYMYPVYKIIFIWNKVWIRSKLKGLDYMRIEVIIWRSIFSTHKIYYQTQ